MRLTTEEFGHVLVMTLAEPRFDATIAQEFKDTARALAASEYQVFLMDMSHVTFMDSSGLGAIVGFMKHIGREKRLELSGLTPVVRKVFRLTRMDAVIRIHPDIESALAAQEDDKNTAAG